MDLTPPSLEESYIAPEATVPDITLPATEKKPTVPRKTEGKMPQQIEKKPRTSRKPAWDSSPASKAKKKQLTPAKPTAKKQVSTPSKTAASGTFKSTATPRGTPKKSSVIADSTSQDTEVPPQTKETAREKGWVVSSSISREPSTSSQRPSSAGSAKPATPAETAVTVRMRKLEKGWVDAEVPSDVLSSDEARDKADAQGRSRVRSSAEVFYRGHGNDASEKLPRALPAINCRAGDHAAYGMDAFTGKASRGSKKTGCVGCSIM